MRLPDPLLWVATPPQTGTPLCRLLEGTQGTDPLALCPDSPAKALHPFAFSPGLFMEDISSQRGLVGFGNPSSALLLDPSTCHKWGQNQAAPLQPTFTTGNLSSDLPEGSEMLKFWISN